VRLLYESILHHLFMISPEKGADTLVWLATTPDLVPGEFYIKRKVARKSAAASDAALARELWDWSERILLR
jgi:hypothetical protein